MGLSPLPHQTTVSSRRIFEEKHSIPSMTYSNVKDTLAAPAPGLSTIFSRKRHGSQSRSSSSMQNYYANVGNKMWTLQKALIKQHKVGQLFFLQSCDAHLSSRISILRIILNSLMSLPGCIDSSSFGWHSLRLSPTLYSFPF